MRRIAVLTVLLMLSGCAAAPEQVEQTTSQATTEPAAQETSTATDAQTEEEPEASAEPAPEAEEASVEPEPEETAVQAQADESSEASEGANESPSPEPEPAESAAAQTYTLADVALRSSADECWVAIDGAVYDLTAWARSHPGGRAAILGLCGTDGTAEFLGQHGGQARPSMTLDEYYLAPLS